MNFFKSVMFAFTMYSTFIVTAVGLLMISFASQIIQTLLSENELSQEKAVVWSFAK